MEAFSRHRRFLPLYAVFTLCLALNIALWTSARETKARWTNVPPAPSAATATVPTLGDAQFAYRLYAIMLQNFGDSAGRVTALKDYDYPMLGEWFMREHALDPKSNFVPYLAAYIFGSSQDPTLIDPVIDYLDVAAGDGAGVKWRWLAQAIYLARFKRGDIPRALEMADKLAGFNHPGMPLWTKQMRAFILTDQGDKAAALELMMNILQSPDIEMKKEEAYAIQVYICTRIFTPDEAASNAFCAQQQTSP